eukprot:TRINITY_DN92405_c0_g1_i1.p1 TRINITY_DN92405_c0_g1~~TRINITY_DN92405_c0_g1_i1.p1  ORF type:complete len:433 (-),score=132.19 TRINITY_DN92405_c0_g1_i1:165-1436(-)
MLYIVDRLQSAAMRTPVCGRCSLSLPRLIRAGLGLLLLHAAGARAASVFAGAADEDAAKKLAETVELKTLSSGDFAFLIKEKRWLSAAQRLLARAQETQLDFSAPVRSAVSSVRKELDDLIRSLDKKYGEASQVSPAFQWAQNSSHVFLQVKFAQRWNAPGALEVENTSITVSDCCFSFKGVGEHSMIRKEYKLFLQFLDPVLQEGSSWHMAAAGRLTVTIAKARARRWERLLRSEHAPENMGVWQDMQEKWKAELTGSSGAKPKKKGDDDDDEEDEDDEKKCEAGTFSGSKVAEFCPEAFLSKKAKYWSVLFYLPDSNTKRSQGVSTVWRALADVVPAHNKEAAVGALDCSRYKAFCDLRIKSADSGTLPLVVKYSPGSSAGETFSGELSLEDLAAWASSGPAEESAPKKAKRRRKASKKEL